MLLRTSLNRRPPSVGQLARSYVRHSTAVDSICCGKLMHVRFGACILADLAGVMFKFEWPFAAVAHIVPATPASLSLPTGFRLDRFCGIGTGQGQPGPSYLTLANTRTPA